jgi:hypothetical protein
MRFLTEEHIMRAHYLTTLLTPVVLLLGLAWLATPAFAAPPARVQICHIPPDDPDNFHTITVIENSLSGHLGHGDLGGACDESCQTLCGDGNACTIAECDPAGFGCVPNDPVDCDDQDLCTTDTCDPASGCGNAPQVCDAPDLCTVGMCAQDTGECVNSPVVCAVVGETCNLSTGDCEDPSLSLCPCANLWLNSSDGATPVDEFDLSVLNCGAGFLNDDLIFLIVNGLDPITLTSVSYVMGAPNPEPDDVGVCSDNRTVEGDKIRHDRLNLLNRQWLTSEFESCKQFLQDHGCVF